MSYHGHFESQKQPGKPRKKKGKGLKIFLIVLAVLLVLIAAVVVWGISYYNKMMNKMNIVTLPENTYSHTEATTTPTEAKQMETTKETEATTVETTRPPMSADDIVNILVVGQAAREGEESHMADTSIVVSLNTYTGEVTLFSILRDTLVRPPDYRDTNGRNHSCSPIKFTTVYNLGYTWGGKENGTVDAMAFTNATLLTNFGVEVDYNIEISFESFIKLIDFMGGIDVELTEAEAKYLNDDDVWVTYDVEPGMQHLDGMAALCYARMRKAEGDSDSDIKRTGRQRQLIEALLGKIRNLSIPELQDVADELLPLITTTMTPSDIANLLMKALPLVKDLQINSHTIPMETTYWGGYKDIYGDGFEHSVLEFDAGQNKKLIRAITEAEG